MALATVGEDDGVAPVEDDERAELIRRGIPASIASRLDLTGIRSDSGTPPEDYGIGRTCEWCGCGVSRYRKPHKASGLDFCERHLDVLPGAEVWAIHDRGHKDDRRRRNLAARLARESAVVALEMLERGEDASDALDRAEECYERAVDGGAWQLPTASQYLLGCYRILQGSAHLGEAVDSLTLLTVGTRAAGWARAA